MGKQIIIDYDEFLDLSNKNYKERIDNLREILSKYLIMEQDPIISNLQTKTILVGNINRDDRYKIASILFPEE